MTIKQRSPRNKTVTLDSSETGRYEKKLFTLPSAEETAVRAEDVADQVINEDLFAALPLLPRAFADLVIIDPPYNLDKDFHGNAFRARSDAEYRDYVETWMPGVLACAKDGASVYVCCDWKSSSSVYSVLARYATIRNRITWQREKGRGAAHNWKNCSEDIWFATIGESWHFDVDAVKHRKKVVAPYRENGEPKDWEDTPDGKFRLTCPSNFWDDLTVPYWSMAENTDHPTQKPEKLAAKLILASSRPGDLVFDPFSGSGTSAVVAKKLGRRFLAIEQNRTYCLWALKRLEQAENDPSVQGYRDGVFCERNSLS